MNVNSPITIKNFRVHVLAYSGRTATTIKSKINGKEGNSVVSITGTGLFTDTTSSDSIMEHELGSIDYIETKSSDDHGVLIIENVSADFSTTISKFNELDATKKELGRRNKENKELRKRLEGTAKELQEKEIQSTNYQKIINNHKCDNRNTFISDVEKDE